MENLAGMTNEALLRYFEAASISYGGADANSQAESDADAQGEAAKAELLRRLRAAVSASPQPRCPKCGSNTMSKAYVRTEGDGMRLTTACCTCQWQVDIYGHPQFSLTDFVQFFAAAPAQEPQKCADEVIAETLAKVDDEEEWTREYPAYRRHVWSDHGEDYTVTIMRVTAAQEQPVEHGICGDCGADRSGPSAEAHDEGCPQKGRP